MGTLLGTVFFISEPDSTTRRGIPRRAEGVFGERDPGQKNVRATDLAAKIRMLYFEQLIHGFVQHKMGQKRLRHAGFPGGLPSKYWPRATELDFGDRTRTGGFSVLWP